MRLDVGEPQPRGLRDRQRGSDLVDGHLLDVGRAVADDRPAAEPPRDEETRVGAVVDAAAARRRHGAMHDDGVAGMEAAGDVGRGDRVEHGSVVAHGPSRKSFPGVGVCLDLDLHRRPSLLRRSRPRHSRPFVATELRATSPALSPAGSSASGRHPGKLPCPMGSSSRGTGLTAVAGSVAARTLHGSPVEDG